MPGFISHTVMARDVFKRIDNKNVSLEYFTTYSLGGDLCKYAKCRYDSHHRDQDKFIYVMADYIKDNKLTNNKEIMGVLYGHICHYVMDDIIHPLVRKIDKSCIKDKSNHTRIEEYYDKYLVNKIEKKNVKEYVKNRLLKGKVNKDIKKMLDYTYKEVYKTDKVSRYYKINLLLYRIINGLYRLFGDNLYKISGMDKFINKNKDINIVNDKHLIKYSDYRKKDSTDSLLEEYRLCIDRSIKYIEDIEKILYDKKINPNT